jgi:hypothetical protein
MDTRLLEVQTVCPQMHQNPRAFRADHGTMTAQPMWLRHKTKKACLIASSNHRSPGLRPLRCSCPGTWQLFFGDVHCSIFAVHLLHRSTMATAKTSTLTFRIEPRLKEALRAAAEREHRSIANMVEVLIRNHCGHHGIAIPLQSAELHTGRAAKRKR